MKTKRIIFIITITAFVLASSCKTQKTAVKSDLVLKNQIDTISYVIGSDFADNLKANGIEINPEVFMHSFKNKTNGGESLFTQEQIQTILTNFQKELQQKQEQTMNQDLVLNKVKGENFLSENKKNAGVKSTASGLQYKVITEGTGIKPGPTSNVTVHYEGKLIDGSIFDSSFKRGESITFGLNQVIPGWTEGLQLMSEGSTYELYIPSNLAYGDRNIPGIPAGSLLIFKVELIKVD